MTNAVDEITTKDEDQSSSPTSPTPSKFRSIFSEPPRKFPKYSALIFALGFVFQFLDSAYVGHHLLMWLQPIPIVLLYVVMLRAPRAIYAWPPWH